VFQKYLWHYCIVAWKCHRTKYKKSIASERFWNSWKRSCGFSLSAPTLPSEEKTAAEVVETATFAFSRPVGKLLSEIWRIKGLSEQEYGPNHPITKMLSCMQRLRHCCRRN
jgi:hypothetical protein